MTDFTETRSMLKKAAMAEPGDTRAGAITEATEAGADIEHVRHAATHSDITQTQRYSRGAAKKIEAVQDKRLAHRYRNDG